MRRKRLVAILEVEHFSWVNIWLHHFFNYIPFGDNIFIRCWLLSVVFFHRHSSGLCTRAFAILSIWTERAWKSGFLVKVRRGAVEALSTTFDWKCTKMISNSTCSSNSIQSKLSRYKKKIFFIFENIVKPFTLFSNVFKSFVNELLTSNSFLSRFAKHYDIPSWGPISDSQLSTIVKTRKNLFQIHLLLFTNYNKWRNIFL